MAAKPAGRVKERIIKKYANRRLYDTAESRYVALEDLRRLVAGGVRFRVVDAQGGEDITRSILLQIIVEQEEKGQPILSTRLLEQLIFYYGDNLQAFVGTYLERSMDFFIKQQEILQNQMQSLLQAAPSSVWNEMAERNLALWRDMQQNLFKAFVSSAAESGDQRKDEEGG
ncbi:MAG: polyhydroxyalkanoate synthesis repressor PhaR [Gammaproteobacteria bacterium]|jgi:polyhydroxyalkanoate synthesis repressor PhaR